MQYCSKHHIPPQDVGKHFEMLMEILKHEAKEKSDSSTRRMAAQISCSIRPLNAQIQVYSKEAPEGSVRANSLELTAGKRQNG